MGLLYNRQAKAAECPIAGCSNSNGARLDMLRTVFVVSLLLLLSGVSLAQMSPAVIVDE